MSFARFSELVRAYGVNGDKWPSSKRPVFAAYATTEEGRTLLEEESKFGKLMQAYTVSDTVSSNLLSRIYALADVADLVNFQWERRFLKISAFSCAACLIAGLAIGLRFGDRFLAGKQPVDAVSRLVFGADAGRGGIYNAIIPE